MPLSIDGVKKRVQGDINDRVLRELTVIRQTGRFVRSLSVNGVARVVEDVRSSTLLHADAVCIETCTLDELVEDTLYTANDQIPSLSQQIGVIADAFRTGGIGSAASQLASVVDGLNWNITVLDHLCQQRSERTSVHELRDTGFTVIRMLGDALENEDYVSVADTLEYEVLPWLNQWFHLTELFKGQMHLERVKRGLAGL